MNQKISVLINTLNEENNLDDCLQMLTWADEIVIVDQYSIDRTVEIAKKYTDKIFYQERTGYASREFGYTKLSHDWILIIDADELLPLVLINEYRNVAENDLADIVIVPRKNYAFGELLKHARWNCLFDPQIRFGKKEFMVLSDLAHYDFFYKNNARVMKITDPDKALIHFAHLDYEQYIDKINRYTTFEAMNIFDGKKKQLTFFGVIYRTTAGFVKNYIWLGGYKDGFRGLAVQVLDMFYISLEYIKSKLVQEYQTKDVKQTVNLRFKELKKEIIAEYNSKQINK
jgi:glycosyltransferase involved in cell wall biosynthesis